MMNRHGGIGLKQRVTKWRDILIAKPGIWAAKSDQLRISGPPHHVHTLVTNPYSEDTFTYQERYFSTDAHDFHVWV